MSAYVVDASHIDALLSVAVHGPKDRCPAHPGDGWYRPYAGELLDSPTTIAPENASEAGADLLAECIASVQHRYPDDSLETLPGPVPIPLPEQYEWTDLGRVFTIAEGLQMISGYEYQSCEHPGWESSAAYHFCNRLRSTLAHSIPGYRDAACWTVTAEQAIGRAGLASF